MKVYELMSKLSEMPSGALVKIGMLKTLEELPEYEEDLREIDFEVKSVELTGTDVILDGWVE